MEGLLNKVTQGDCLEVMKNIEDGVVDFTVTSPPYYNARDYAHYNTYDDYLNFIREIACEIYRITSEGRYFAINVSTVIEPRRKRSEESVRYAIPFHIVRIIENEGFSFVEDIVWVKPEGAAKNRNGGFFRHRKPLAYKPNIINEYIFLFRKSNGRLIDDLLKRESERVSNSLITGEYERSNVWSMSPETKVKEHSAPFPVTLPQKLIEYYSLKGDTVFDPFLGSGTTAVAAINTGRQFIGIEREQQYVDIANERIQAAYDAKSTQMEAE